MANSDKVTPARRDIYIGDIKESRPNSENVNAKLAGTVNFVLDRLVVTEKTAVNGFIFPGDYDDGVGGIIRVENRAVISSYNLALKESGSGGTTSFNYAVYDSSGGFVNNLFSLAPSISGSNGVNVMVGKDGANGSTPSSFQVNTSGHTFNHGTLTLGTDITPLEAGYILVPFIVTGGTDALNLVCNLKLKEL